MPYREIGYHYNRRYVIIVSPARQEGGFMGKTESGTYLEKKRGRVGGGGFHEQDYRGGQSLSSLQRGE